MRTPYFNKQERHQIYVGALEWINTKHDPLDPYSICESLDETIRKLFPEKYDLVEFGRQDPYDSLECLNGHYPEVEKHKPAPDMAYWFAANDKDSRVAILEQAIKETEDENKEEQTEA